MSPFEVWALIALGAIAFALLVLASVVEKWTRHLSNIADRLLDIDRTLNKRR